MNKAAPSHVVIVGGGLIGLSAAFSLVNEGHKVTIIERDRLGAGAAEGNAGELTPQQVAPLASKNTALDVTRGVFTRSSYLSISPLKLFHLAKFGIGFILASGKNRMAYGAKSLAQFSDGMFESLDRMTAAGIDTGGGGEGYLMTNSDEKDLQAVYKNYQDRAAKGWGEKPGPIIRGEELHKFEPSLDKNVTAGFMLPAERWLDPITFVASLAKYLEEKGVEVRTGLTAKRIGQGAAVVCEDASGNEVTVAGDKLIIAAGAWTTPILKKSGVKHLEVVSGKGYSFTVPVKTMPERLIHSMDLHAVLIPMNGRLRVVGQMEFDEKPETFHEDQVEVLRKSASGLLHDADWNNLTDLWHGPRPMTADGMPILGEIPGRKDVFVASGHNMHGLSLGPITGDVLADLVAGRPAMSAGKKLDMHPFRVNR